MFPGARRPATGRLVQVYAFDGLVKEILSTVGRVIAVSSRKKGVGGTSVARRLLIVGASARGAAMSAARAGFAPFAIDLFADDDLRNVAETIRIADFRRDLPQAFRRMPPMPWMYTGGLENHPRLVEQLAAERPLWGNSAACLRRVRDPAVLRCAVEEAGLRFPPMGKEAAEGPRLVKPRRSAAGHGIRLIGAGEPVSVPRGHYVQQWIAGRACSAAYVAARGRALLLGTAEQLVGKAAGEPYAYVGSIAPLSGVEAVSESLARLGQVLASRFGLVGLFGVDFIWNEEGIWVLEVNPRYTASLEVVEQALGVSAIEEHAAACVDGRLPAREAEAAFGLRRYCGKAIIYADRDAVVTDATCRLIQHWNWAARWLRVADVPPAGATFRRGEPMLTVFAAASSRDAVLRRLKQREARVLETLEGLPSNHS